METVLLGLKSLTKLKIKQNKMKIHYNHQHQSSFNKLCRELTVAFVRCTAQKKKIPFNRFSLQIIYNVFLPEALCLLIWNHPVKKTRTSHQPQQQQLYVQNKRCIAYSRDLEKKLFAMGLDFTKQNTTEVYEVKLEFFIIVKCDTSPCYP